MSRLRLRVSAVIGVLLVTVACADDGSPGSGPTSTSDSSATTSTSPTRSDPAGPTLPDEVDVVGAGGETIPAAPFADFMVASGDGIWVSGVDPGVVRYDARTGKITARVRFDNEVVQAMESARDVVYAVGWTPPALLRIDATTGRALSTTPLDGDVMPESSVAVDGSTAWVLVDGGKRFQVVRDGRVTGTMAAPDGALAARFGFGSIWVTAERGQVVRLAPDDGMVEETYEVGLGARFLTIGEDAVWTLDAADGTVSRVDTKTGQVQTVLVSEFPIQGGDVAAGLGAVWARTNTGVTRIDPVTVAATDRLTVPFGSGDVAAAAGWLWVSDHDHDAVHRVPLTGLSGG